MSNFGPFGNVERMIGQMSTPELTNLAKNPTGGDPMVQYAALGELEKRTKMAQAQPQGPGGPQPSVVDQMAMQAMTPRQPTPAPQDPISNGVMAMMKQQGQPKAMAKGGRVQKMNTGGQPSGAAGRIVNNMGGVMDMISPYYDTEERFQGPDDAMDFIHEFYGDGSYLTDMIPGIKEDEAQADTDRRRDLWLALAQAGFGMASTGNIGQGAMMGMEQARGALNTHRDARRDARGRRDRVSLAQGQRGDQMAGRGLEALLQDRNRASGARQSLVTQSAGIAGTGAQIDASNANSRSQLEQIAEMLYQENQGEQVLEAYNSDTSSTGRAVRHRQYSRADAMRDALQMLGGTRGSGSRPDDASELTRIAVQLNDPVSNMDAASRLELIRLYNSIAARSRTNGLNAPDWPESSSSGGNPRDRRNRAPTENDYSPQHAQEVSEAFRRRMMSQNGTGGSVLDYEDGTPVYGADRSQFEN